MSRAWRARPVHVPRGTGVLSPRPLLQDQRGHLRALAPWRRRPFPPPCGATDDAAGAGNAGPGSGPPPSPLQRSRTWPYGLCLQCGDACGWLDCRECGGRGWRWTKVGNAGVAGKIGRMRCRACGGQGWFGCIVCWKEGRVPYDWVERQLVGWREHDRQRGILTRSEEKKRRRDQKRAEAGGGSDEDGD